MTVELFDDNKIQGKLSNLRKQLENRTKEIETVSKQIEELDDKKEELETLRKEETLKNLDKMSQEFTFINEVKSKIEEIREAHRRAMATKATLMDLYQRAFKGLSSQRVTVPQDIILMTDGFYQSYLTLNNKGFGFAREHSLPSKPVTDLKELQKIFCTPQIADLITKPDKIDMFHAFEDAFANWIIPDVADEQDRIALTANVQYIQVESSTYSSDIKINTYTTNNVTIERDQYGNAYYMLIQTGQKGIQKFTFDTLKFGELYVLAQVWEKFEEAVDTLMRKYKSIADNNEVVIGKLTKKISSHLVADEL